MEQYIQVTLVTKSARYSVPSSPISLTASTTPADLNKLISELLIESGDHPNVEFVFLIQSEFLQTSLAEHCLEKQIASEVLEIEYCEKQKAPTFEFEIQQEDWISCVKRFRNYVLTGSYDGTVQIWSVENSKCMLTLDLDDRVKCVEWLTFDIGNNRATFVTGSFDQTIHLWDWDIKSNQARCVVVCRGHAETVMTAAACPTTDAGSGNAQWFATGSWDNTIKLWSASSEVTDLSEETGGIAHHRKSNDKQATRVPLLTLAGHRETITRVCWLLSSDSEQSKTQLVSSSWDHTIRIWDCVNTAGVELRSIGSSHAIHDIDAASHGILAASSDNRVRIFDLRTSDALSMIGFQGHTGWLTSVAWAPHQTHHFVTGSIDRTVRLWDTRNPRASLFDLMGHTDIVTDVDWAPPVPSIKTVEKGADYCRHYILSASGDGSVKIYNYPE